jgi:hypothetical protein
MRRHQWSQLVRGQVVGAVGARVGIGQGVVDRSAADRARRVLPLRSQPQGHRPQPMSLTVATPGGRTSPPLHDGIATGLAAGAASAECGQGAAGETGAAHRVTLSSRRLRWPFLGRSVSPARMILQVPLPQRVAGPGCPLPRHATQRKHPRRCVRYANSYPQFSHLSHYSHYSIDVHLCLVSDLPHTGASEEDSSNGGLALPTFPPFPLLCNHVIVITVSGRYSRVLTTLSTQ